MTDKNRFRNLSATRTEAVFATLDLGNKQLVRTENNRNNKTQKAD